MEALWTQKSAVPWRALWDNSTAQHQLFLRGGGGIFLSTKWITDQRKALGEKPLSNVIFESALICPPPNIYHKKKIPSKNVLLHLKSDVYHETALTLTHISTTLTMHWGKWQRACGHLLAERNLAFRTCPEFHRHIFAEKVGVNLVHGKVQDGRFMVTQRK